jgi:uncharacterized membrane protein
MPAITTQKSRNQFIEKLLGEPNPGYTEIALDLDLTRDYDGGMKNSQYVLTLKGADVGSDADLSKPRVDLDEFRKLAKLISLGLKIPARETRYKVAFITEPDEWDMNLMDFVRSGKIRLSKVDENDPPENIQVEANADGVRLIVPDTSSGPNPAAFAMMFVAPALVWGFFCWLAEQTSFGVIIGVVLLFIGYRMVLSKAKIFEHIEITPEALSVYGMQGKKRIYAWSTPLDAVVRLSGPAPEVIMKTKAFFVGNGLETAEAPRWLRKYLTRTIYRFQSLKADTVPDGSPSVGRNPAAGGNPAPDR